MQTLQELFKKPKEFVAKCQEYLTQLGYDKPYEYDRFLAEELTELITNHESGAHANNRALLVDDICDSLWVCLAKYEGSREDRLHVILMGRDVQRYNSTRVEQINHDLQRNDLWGIIFELYNMAYDNNIDLTAAFSALVDENMSKLGFEESYKEIKDFMDEIYPPQTLYYGAMKEIFRTGKLNKKDLDGNLYPWVKLCDFSRF